MTSAPAISLRDYQERAVEGVRQAFREGRRAPLLVAPTGAGKTVMFSYIAAGAARRGKRVGILAHRKELIDQASKKLIAAGVQHGIIAPRFTPTSSLVQVASVQTLARRLSQSTVPFDLLVIDEAHHAIAGQWQTIAAAYPDALMLGVTATPERLDGRGLGVEAGGCFDAMVMGPSVADLVSLGYLTPAKIYAPAETPDLSGVRTKGGDYDALALSEAMAAPKLVGDAVAHYQRYVPGQPAILFSPSVAHAEQMADAFRAAGWRGVAASGATPANERDAAIKGLASGAVQVLCAADLISEGLDVPAVSAVILLRPTKSLGLYLQQVGRGLRPAPGKTHLTILDHAGNTLRHGPPEIERVWSLEGRAKKKKNEDQIPPARQCPDCFAVHAPAPRCPDCGFVYPVKPRELEHVAGELSDVTSDLAQKFGKHIPLAKVLATASDADLKVIAKIRGYAPGWVWHQRQQRRQGVLSA